MTDNEKIRTLVAVMREVEDIADCAKGLDDDNKGDALQEILALARKILKNKSIR